MTLIRIASILVAYLCLAHAVPLDETVQAPATKADVNYRLPQTVKPVNYQIILKPYLRETDSNRFTFEGECFIEIQAEQRTREIRLHMKNLQISVAEYYRKGSAAKTNLTYATPDNLTDIVAYTLNEELQANTPYILHYKYTGSMDEDMHGFYRSNYTTSNNVTKWLGSTQFETNHARRAFPSFDEPKFKATFDLSLIHHRSFKSAGPTPLAAVHFNGDSVTDVYDTTPKMSTYVLAFIVSEFNDRSDGQFGVLARPEYYSQTEYSFQVGQQLLETLDKLFNLSYYSLGNKKMEMAAIPDFSAGAMENWGLLTFRERALLYHEGDSTLSSKQYIASVVAHELAHMWFGNLVTCDWWSYTWLNEGFARYFQYYATDIVESQFEVAKQFVVDQVQTVMGMDATNDTNPMTDENTNTPADLSRMFNSISYNKGATFIRMTKQILGEENFQKSLNEYLDKHKYTNTVPEDLFTIWKKYWPAEFAAEADSYFYSFTKQVGYPVVTCNRTSVNYVRISQERFLLKDFDEANPTLSYTVPITYTISSEANFTNTYPQLFLGKTNVTIMLGAENEWLIGNIQETGYYRVNYDTNSWKDIKKALHASNYSGIHESNRAQIVDDILTFARAGRVDYSLAFDVIEYLKNEINYLPWTSAFNALNFLNIRLGTDTQDFARYIRHMTNKAYEKLGFEEKANDTTLDIYLRNKIISWACRFGNQDCISKAKSYFAKNLLANPVPVNIRGSVYCTALREGSSKDFNKLYQKFLTESVATEQTLILGALGCVKGEKLVTEYFNKILSPEIRRQDKSSAMSSLYSENNENIDILFKLVDTEIDRLSEAMGGASAVASVVSSIAQRFTTEAQLENLKAFNVKHKTKFGSSISTLESAVKSVERNLDWSKAKLGSIRSVLYKHGRNGATANSISLVSVMVVALIAMVFH